MSIQMQAIRVYEVERAEEVEFVVEAEEAEGRGIGRGRRGREIRCC